MSLGISSIICVIEIDFYCLFKFLSYFYIFFLIRRGGCHCREQHKDRKVKLVGPKSDIRMAEKSQGPKIHSGML